MNNLSIQSSMLKWYPLTKEVNVKQPKTEMLELTWEEARSGEDYFTRSVHNKIVKWFNTLDFDFPVFIRTDLSSCKHQFEDTCFVKSKEDFPNHLDELILENRLLDIMGMPFKAIVVREFITLDSRFKSFKGMPFAPEIRFFYQDGKYICHHNYWPIESLWGQDDENWEKHYYDVDQLIKAEAEDVKKEAKKVASVLKGYWSIDFAKAKDGDWFFVDSAIGVISYHDPACNVKLDD